MRVAILHDDIPASARADEVDVFVQADAIAAALTRLGHTSERLPFSFDLREVTAGLAKLKADVAFNLVESVEGKGRYVVVAPTLLDQLKVPYTGVGAEAMLLTSSKLLTKERLEELGLSTPAWLPAQGAGSRDLRLPGRFIIKSVWEEASLGLEDDAVVEAPDRTTLRKEIVSRADRLGGEAFAEKYIPGREFNLSVLCAPHFPQVLPAAEIRFVDYPPDRLRMVGYRAKWDPDSFEYQHTPRCFDFPSADTELLDSLEWLAAECWLQLGLRGYVRVDFRVDEHGWPWILEINGNPCLSPDAGFPAAAARAGLSFEELVERILADARYGEDEDEDEDESTPNADLDPNM